MNLVWIIKFLDSLGLNKQDLLLLEELIFAASNVLSLLRPIINYRCAMFYPLKDTSAVLLDAEYSCCHCLVLLLRFIKFNTSSNILIFNNCKTNHTVYTSTELDIDLSEDNIYVRYIPAESSKRVLLMFMLYKYVNIWRKLLSFYQQNI